MYKLHYDNFLINGHDDEHLLIRLLLADRNFVRVSNGPVFAAQAVKSQLLMWKLNCSVYSGKSEVRELYVSFGPPNRWF